MKKSRRFAAMAATMALALCAVAPVASFTASATNVKVDTDSDNAKHTYQAYQIFKGEIFKVNNVEQENTLTIKAWGDGYNSSGLLADNDFKSLVITTAGDTTPAVTVGSFLGDKTDAASVAQAIEKLNYDSGTSKADALASILQKYVDTTKSTTLSDNATNLAAGYWIVIDSYTANADVSDGNEKPDAVSKHILKVTGGSEEITITPKKSYPTVVKKVKENTDVGDYTYIVGETAVTDEDYNDVADYNIGDSVPFKLYGTMPSTYGDYDHYYYLFTDTLDNQFDAPEATGITVKVVNPDSNGDDKAEFITLTLDSDYTVSIDEDNDNNVIKVEFMDTKKISSITKDSYITVEYNAVLNNTANIGSAGQKNTIDLEYSNNPYNTGNGSNKPTDTDKTPEHAVIVFTYEVDINKVDAATGAVLADAEFVLSRGTGDAIEYVTVDNKNCVSGWTKTQADASTLKTDENGKVIIQGLDKGTYSITETKAPASYNKLSKAIGVTITAETENGELTAFNYTVSSDEGEGVAVKNISNPDPKDAIADVKISNEKGVQLPSTGGIGTTLFVMGGGCTAALAGIYLISKKRAKDEEAE